MASSDYLPRLAGALGVSVLPLLAMSPAMAASSVTIAPAEVKISSEQYAFGSERNVTVKSTGTSPASIGLVTFDGPDAGDFAIVSDSCTNHTIAPRKSCKIRLRFSATAPFHATETATLAVNDSDGMTMASVALVGMVSKKQVWAGVSGATVTLYNQTQFQYELEPFLDGPFADTGTGTCGSILGGNHGSGQARILTCTYVFQRTGPGPGSLDVGVFGFTGGKNYDFTLPLN